MDGVEAVPPKRPFSKKTDALRQNYDLIYEHSRLIIPNGDIMQQIKRICFLGVIISSAILIQGCATSMMKASPFYTGDLVCGVSKSGKIVRWDDPESSGIKKITLNQTGLTQETKRLDDDRINVWPIFYKNFLIYSIVWPIGEVNDVGWEIRPLISVDNYNKSYNAMAYMWGYNAKDGYNYFFPIYLNNQKLTISLLGGWGENFVYIVPPLFMKGKRDDGDECMSIIYPFSQFNLTKNKSYVFPLYSKGEKYFYSMLFGWDKDLLYVLPPLFINAEENSYFFIWPFSGYDSKTGESYVFPIYGRSKDAFYSLLFGYDDDVLYVLPPSFIMGKNSDGNDYNIMWPLCSLYPAKNKYYSLPLFYYSDDNDNKDFFFSYLMPMGWSWDNSYSSGSLFVPLYLNSTSKNDGKSMTLTPLFLEKNNFENFMTPLFGWLNNGDDYYVTPLFIRNKYEKYSDYRIIGPFGNLRLMNEKKEEIPGVQGHFYPLFSYYKDEKGYDFNLLFPFISFGNKVWDNYREEHQMAFPFYYYYKDNDFTHNNYGLFGTTCNSINNSNYSAWYLLPFYYNGWDKIVNHELDLQRSHRNDKGVIDKTIYSTITTAKESSFILPNIFLSENAAQGKSDFTVFPFYFHEKNKNMISDSSLLWLYTRKESTEKKTVDAQAFWFLYYYSYMGKTETQKESSVSRILWKLYHRQKIEDETNVDIFPFISYNEDTDSSKFSFCWRLLNYEKDNDSLKVHLLFIPVYW